MSYTKPQDAVRPLNSWCITKVLYEDGPDGCSIAKGKWGEEEVLAIRWNGSPDGLSIAKGKWDGEEVVAMRWNGNAEREKGHLLSNGQPIWFILPSKLASLVEFSLALGLWPRATRRQASP